MPKAERHTARDHILALAREYHAKFYSGEYKRPINTICTTVCKELIGKGYNISPSYIHQVLPSYYKETRHTPNKFTRT